jgi:hypothetical protein
MNSIDKENGVAPGRGVIIIRTRNFPIFVSKSDQIHNLVVVLHLHLHQPFQDYRLIDLLQPHSLC